MTIKFPADLTDGDIIAHNNCRYRVKRYSQGRGAGSFDYGEYGILYVNEIISHEVIDNKVDPNEKLLNQTGLRTFAQYPFVVLCPTWKS